MKILNSEFELKKLLITQKLLQGKHIPTDNVILKSLKIVDNAVFYVKIRKVFHFVRKI